jgi:hypothetical protein
MPGLGGLSGLGGVYGGYIQAEGDEATARKKKYDIDQQQAGDLAFGRTLQLLGQGGQSPMPQGGPPMGPLGMQPPMGGPPQGMHGGMPQQAPPMRSPMPPPQMQQPGQPPMGGPPPGGGMPPQPPMPQGQPGMQGMPPGPPQMGQQGPSLDWRSIMQKVQQANPGAPPNVLAAAVDRFLPLMNQQSQMEWKQYSMMLQQGRLDLQQDRLGMEQERINTQRQALGLPPLGPGQMGQVAGQGGGQGGGQSAEPQLTGPQKIGQAIIDGEQPPVLTGLYRQAPQVRSYLADKGFDLTSAQLQWTRAQKQIQALNGPQMERFVGLAESVNNTIDEAKALAQQFKNSGIAPLNHLKLVSLINTAGNTPEGQLATKYVTAIGTLKEEFANLAQGGYAPTESVWALANKQINENYGVDQLSASLSEIQRLVRYRLKAIPNIDTLGPNAPNRYTKPQPGISATGEPTKPSGWSEDSGAVSAGPKKIDRAAAKKAGYTDKEIDDFEKGQ